MKVVCVKQPINKYGSTFTEITVGDIFEVVNTHFLDDFYWHEFKELKGFGYRVDCFSPLSDIDETELVNEKELLNS